MTPMIVVLALALTGLAHQERPTTSPPKKGDAVVVKGCLKWPLLESTETTRVDTPTGMMTAYAYRLTGNKATLKQMRQEHDGNLVEVTGTLKSHLPPAGEGFGKTFGKTRVRIGIGSSDVGSQANAEANRSMPVLEVKSFDGTPAKCGG